MFNFGVVPDIRLSGTPPPLVDRFRVINTMMKDAVQYAGKTPGNFVKIFKSQLTFVQLAINKDIINQFLNQPLYTVR
jgi:hypothetical protein